MYRLELYQVFRIRLTSMLNGEEQASPLTIISILEVYLILWPPCFFFLSIFWFAFCCLRTVVAPHLPSKQNPSIPQHTHAYTQALQGFKSSHLVTRVYVWRILSSSEYSSLHATAICSIKPILDRALVRVKVPTSYQDNILRQFLHCSLNYLLKYSGLEPRGIPSHY